MKGLELCRRYWEEVGRPALAAALPEVLDRAAAGLAGEGSECFGFDDEISRDHDWGPGFCLWMTKEDILRWGGRAAEVYASLPREFLGFQRLNEGPLSGGRVGVLEINYFYRRYLGPAVPPQTLGDWRRLPEEGLATATNGQVFQDPLGAFTDLRQALLAYFPEDVRRKKIATRCALAAQSGQYNYPRCLRRGDAVPASLALAQFIGHAQALVVLLNRRYRPYYKWAQRAMAQLPILGRETAPLLEALAGGGGGQEAVEAVCALVIRELERQGLSSCPSDFLLPHAEEVLSRIQDPELRASHPMSD